MLNETDSESEYNITYIELENERKWHAKIRIVAVNLFVCVFARNSKVDNLSMIINFYITNKSPNLNQTGRRKKRIDVFKLNERQLQTTRMRMKTIERVSEKLLFIMSWTTAEIASIKVTRTTTTAQLMTMTLTTLWVDFDCVTLIISLVSPVRLHLFLELMEYIYSI